MTTRGCWLRQMPPAALSRVFLMFPDPWPKARHAKRRFVHPDNLALVARAMRPGGEWRIASDDPTYQAWTASVLAEQPWFSAPPPSTERPAGWPPTRYEEKARRAGRTPLWWAAVRTELPAADEGLGGLRERHLAGVEGREQPRLGVR